jgi:hypothetical protein
MTSYADEVTWAVKDFFWGVALKIWSICYLPTLAVLPKRAVVGDSAGAKVERIAVT